MLQVGCSSADAIGTSILDALRNLSGPELYLLVLAAAFGETMLLAGLVVPGEISLALAGTVAASGDANVVLVIVVGIVGATAGDTASFLVGRRWGVPFICRWGPMRRRFATRLGRAHEFFATHGGRAVFLARFVGILRAFLPVTAGAAGMKLRRFVGWSLAASIVWTSSIVLLGYVFGDAVISVLDSAGLVVIVLAALIAVAWFGSKLVRGRSKPVTPSATEPPVVCETDGTPVDEDVLGPEELDDAPATPVGTRRDA